MVKAKKEMKGVSKVAKDAELGAVEDEIASLEDSEMVRKQTLLLAKLVDKVKREDMYSKRNNRKIDQQWRAIMRRAKVAELRRELEVLSQNHEREVDRKDAVAQMLDRDLGEAEEQYQMALRAHLRIVDALIDLQYARIRAVERDFNAYLAALTAEFDAERLEINNSMVRQRKDFSDMSTAMEIEFAELENEVRQEFDGAKEEIKNKSSEEYNVLKISLESTIEDLEKQFEQAHQTYLASTEQRTQMFRQLTKNDAESATIIERRMKKLQRLGDGLQHWRIKIASNSREWEEKNKAMYNEKSVMSRHYQSLKANMVRYRAHEGAKLKALSLHSGGSIKDLDAKLELAHRILLLAQTCRKLETEQEKIMPFPVATVITPEEAALIVAEEGEAIPEKPLAGMEPQVPDGSCSYAIIPGTRTSGGEGEGGDDEAASEGRLVEEWEHLDGFLQRFNKVLIDRVAIEREKGRLEKENEDLRTLLKQYLDGISVNENVINNPANPLFIVNGKLQLNHRSAPPAAGAAAADPRKPRTLQFSNPAAVVAYSHGGVR